MKTETWKQRLAKGVKAPSVVVHPTRELVEGTPLEKLREGGKS